MRLGRDEPKLPDNDATVNFIVNIIFRIDLRIPARLRLHLAESRELMGGEWGGRMVGMDRTPMGRDIYVHSHKYIRVYRVNLATQISNNKRITGTAGKSHYLGLFGVNIELFFFTSLPTPMLSNNALLIYYFILLCCCIHICTYCLAAVDIIIIQ